MGPCWLSQYGLACTQRQCHPLSLADHPQLKQVLQSGRLACAGGRLLGEPSVLFLAQHPAHCNVCACLASSASGGSDENGTSCTASSLLARYVLHLLTWQVSKGWISAVMQAVQAAEALQLPRELWTACWHQCMGLALKQE